ncbi:macrophage mannose receptor 1-like [Puntigrus tetrazona]|uniref:macrophage mannose receptor 1-like n=1 Tax=Puntigrus tetrazona TaxID=1606681 RepID=UPI001C89E57E|nr:macrophage mannose receptor 1-like [Puntigrus tetrazona]
MTWKDAQSYCRTNHIDLATVQTDEDWASLQEETNRLFGVVWIGLYNDINGWRWSYNQESLVFKSWASGQPDNYYGKEECVAFNNGVWSDFTCTISYNFICYDGSSNVTQKMVLGKTTKTWVDAQTFCRGRYTDLATIRSPEEREEITTLTRDVGGYWWIGLHRDNWKWSDQANVTSSTKLITDGFGARNYDCIDANIYYRTINIQLCSTNYYFSCNTVRRNRQVIRMQVKTTENTSDTELKTLVLNKLQQTLRDEDVTVMWRTQPNGKVFQEINTVQKQNNTNTTRDCSWLE